MTRQNKADSPATCRIRLNAHVDMGTGLTADDQRAWLDRARAELTDALLTAVLAADDSFGTAAVVATDDGLIFQADVAADAPAIVATKLGRDAAYADVHPMASVAQAAHAVGVRWDQWAGVYHGGRYDSGRCLAGDLVSVMAAAGDRYGDQIPLLTAVVENAKAAR